MIVFFSGVYIFVRKQYPSPPLPPKKKKKSSSPSNNIIQFNLNASFLLNFSLFQHLLSLLPFFFLFFYRQVGVFFNTMRKIRYRAVPVIM
jgi:hypothetical protein